MSEEGKRNISKSKIKHHLCTITNKQYSSIRSKDTRVQIAKDIFDKTGIKISQSILSNLAQYCDGSRAKLVLRAYEVASKQLGFSADIFIKIK